MSFVEEKVYHDIYKDDDDDHDEEEGDDGDTYDTVQKKSFDVTLLQGSSIRSGFMRFSWLVIHVAL